MPELCLYIAPGACSRVPLIALESTGYPFRTELVRFMKGEHKSVQFKTLNPSGKIPILEVDGEAIPQNVAILTWLAKNFPDASLLPDVHSSLQEAKLLSSLSRFSADLHPLVTRIRMPHFFCDREEGSQRVYEMAVVAMSEQLLQIEAELKENTWLFGNQWSVLDAYLHWVWFRITGAGFDQTPFPNIALHYSRTLEIPAVQRAIEKEQAAEAQLKAEGLMPRF